jgi:hypothetical protein
LKYIRKVEPIEAIQWNGTGRYDVIICAYKNGHNHIGREYVPNTGQVSVYAAKTRSGLKQIDIGDWVIEDGKYNDIVSDKYFQENYVPYVK